MNNRKINLSGPTISPNTYAGNFGNKYIAAALLSGETLAKDLITVHPNVAFKEVIRNYQDSIVADSRCNLRILPIAVGSRFCWFQRIRKVTRNFRRVRFGSNCRTSISSNRIGYLEIKPFL
jgi:hypothetical protein